MVSSLPSYDDELLNSAYANISLIADKTWIFDKEDPFHQLNQTLWTQNCKLSAIYKENVEQRGKRVQDVIPDSNLSKYGSFEYNEEREKFYRQDDTSSPTVTTNFCWTEVTEAWMLPEVEEAFTRIVSSGTRSNRELPAMKMSEMKNSLRRTILKEKKRHWSNKTSPTNKNHETSMECLEKPEDNHRYSIENSEEMQLHFRVTCEAVRSLWYPAKNQQFDQRTSVTRSQYCQQQQQQYLARREQTYQGRSLQQQFYCAVQYQPLILRTEYQTTRTEAHSVPRKPLPPVLSPEVPEFFPKVPNSRYNCPKEQNGNRVQYFPSLNERSYQNELFPYNRLHKNVGNVYQNPGVPIFSTVDSSGYVRAPQQWFQRVPPTTQICNATSTPVCATLQPLRATTITHHSLQMQEKFLPTMQTCPTPIPVYQRPMELYHETAQKRKNQGVDFKNLILLTKNAIKAHRGQKNPQQRQNYVLETRNRNSKTEQEVLRWLDKGYGSRSKDFPPTKSEMKSFQEKCDYERTSNWKGVDNRVPERLKSETRVTGKSSAAKSTSVRDESYSRTRRRLYRDVLANTSTNETALENIFDKRYDELEQQAMEQYRASEESLALKYQELERQAMEQYKCCNSLQDASCNPTEEREKPEETTKNQKEKDCIDGKKCSGLGGCSPQNRDGRTKDCSLRPQITLLKPGNKSGRNGSNRSSCERNTPSTVVTKSLTKLSQKISGQSKNTSKGASGDKIDKNVSVRTTSKRRLILVSPFERKSEARLMGTTDLKEIYCISESSKNIFDYYDNTKLGKAGGGDENVTIMQPPKTEVWLSGFWST